MKLYSSFDNPVLRTAEDMAETLGVFMKAYYSKISTPYLTKNSTGSNWRKYMNTFAIEASNLLDRIKSNLNNNIDGILKSQHKIYMFNVPSTIKSISSIVAHHSSVYKQLVKADNLYDFMFGVPSVYETVITTSTNEFILGSNRVASDYNGAYMVSSVTVNGYDTLYTLYYDENNNRQYLYTYSNLAVNDVMRVSYRTSDCYYHDEGNYIVYTQHDYNRYGGNDLFVYANNGWYPEQYTSGVVTTGYQPVYYTLWNGVDSLGLLCDTPRLHDEPDNLYLERIRDAYIYLPGFTKFGMRNILAKKLNLIQHKIWDNDRVIYNLSNIWEDSVRVDYRPIDHYSYKCLGIGVPDNVVDGSIRLFRNGLLRHMPDDYIIRGDTIVLSTPITSSENIIIDYLLKTGNYYTMYIYNVPSLLIDGIRKDFALQYPQMIGKTQVYHNLLRNSNGPDYDERAGHVIFTNAPLAGDNVTIIYYVEEQFREFGFSRVRAPEICDGINNIFTIEGIYDIMSLYVNGGYVTEGLDYDMIDDNHVRLYIAPEIESKVEACLYRYEVPYAIAEGAEFEQVSIIFMPDGCIKWNIGSLEPSTRYRKLNLRLQYIGVSDRDFNDVWLTGYMTSGTMYANDNSYINTITYRTSETSIIKNNTTDYMEHMKPDRDGYVYERVQDPGILYGYIPRYPEFDVNVSYINTDLLSTTRIRHDDNIEYTYNVRNIGNKIADDCVMTIYLPMHYVLVNDGGGLFHIECKTPRGLRHDVRYILSSRWSSNVTDSVNIFPIHDEYYVPRLLLDDELMPKTDLVNMVEQINNVSPILWGYGKWDYAAWDTYDNVYGDIHYTNQLTMHSARSDIVCSHADRYNYSFLPHRYDTSMESYPQSIVYGMEDLTDERASLPRRMDFRSGIGFDKDLEVDIHLNEYTYNNASKEYQYPAYINTGVFYLNDIYGYQFDTANTVSINSNHPLAAGNVTYIPEDATDLHVVIFDNSCLARRTCFFNNYYQPTHEYTELLYGNAINTKLRTTFSDINITNFVCNNTGLDITHYDISDNIINLHNVSSGVEYTIDHEYLINVDTTYTITYTLNNSYYVNGVVVYFDKHYDNILIRYNSGAGQHNTGIVINPMYTPYSSKFLYADVFEPVPETIRCWVSPINIKAHSMEPVFVICEVLDKHGSPIQYQAVSWVSSDTQTYSNYTDKFGRSTWKLTINDLTNAGTTVNITATVANKSCYCSVYVY